MSEPVWMVKRGDRAYPACLTDLDPGERPSLYGVGRREAITDFDHASAVTIVGARRASAYGLRVAERLARELSLAGVTVVSGMARGIDAAAHRGALAGGGRTLAVLGNGPDVIYPPMHRDLYERIVEAGAAIAEHPPGSPAHKRHFPARNRIMAALGRVIVIVEAAQPSGTLITADLGLRLGRTVAAVPGQLGTRVAEGANDLLKEGAHLIRDARDVLDLLYGVGADSRPPAGELNRIPPPRPGVPLEPRLREILGLLHSGAASVDRIALEARIAPREAAVALARLERFGYVSTDALGTPLPTGLEAPP
jgi:DNA processing protein